MTTIFPDEDKEAVLHNPDMGWVLYDNYCIHPEESPADIRCPVYGYDFPGVDTVMLKFTWADIEKAEGVYDFTDFDYIYDYWRNRGKTITLGMSADSLLWYGKAGTGVPDYLLQQLPRDRVQVRRSLENPQLLYTLCDAGLPLYQERLSLFLSSCDNHFKKSGRPIRYIDLRGYGLWGEWHRGYRYPDLETKRRALDGVMRIWSSSFPDAWLALSYSYDPDEPCANYTDPQEYEKYLYWSAFDLAMNYPNITLRRDGAGGAVQNNERIFCREVFEKLERGPFTSEGVGGYDSPEAARRILEDGLTLHPNYFTIIGWAGQGARDFIEKEPFLFAKGLREMGYRLVPLEIRYPEKAEAGGSFEVVSRWVNRGTGRAARDFYLYGVLADREGHIRQEFPLDSTGCSRWSGTQPEQPILLRLRGYIPEAAEKGEMVFGIVMRDKDGRTIALPLRRGQPGGWTPLGKLTIQ